MSTPVDLPWDGSDLGEIYKCDIIDKYKHDNDVYWRINIAQYIKNNYIYVKFCIWVLVKKLQSTHPLIIDELKSILHLKKKGTHQIKHGSVSYMFIKIRVYDDKRIYDPSLNQIMHILKIKSSETYNDNTVSNTIYYD